MQKNKDLKERNQPIIRNAPLKYSSSNLGGNKGLCDNSSAVGRLSGSCCKSRVMTANANSELQYKKMHLNIKSLTHDTYFLSGEYDEHPTPMESGCQAFVYLQVPQYAQLQS